MPARGTATAGHLMFTERLIIGCLSFQNNFYINKIIPQDDYTLQPPLQLASNHVMVLDFFLDKNDDGDCYSSSK